MNELSVHPLKYRIIGSSSEDPDFPLFSLISGGQNEGWHSIRFCTYPQEILIQFTQPVRLRQVNILLHQTFIPSSIEFFYFFPEKYDDFFKDYNSLTFNKIGYVTPDSNSKTDYKAREYKKVAFNENVLYLKLVLNKCIYNLYNTFNQVAIISIECFGFDFTVNNIDYLFPNRNKSLNYFANNMNNYIPNPNLDDNDLDEVCINKIDELKLQLNRCVEEENYDQAKVINELIQRIKILGQKIYNLQEIKFKSIEVNDYDNAKIVKNEIERIKNIIKEVVVGNFVIPDEAYTDLPENQMNINLPQQNFPDELKNEINFKEDTENNDNIINNNENKDNNNNNNNPNIDYESIENRPLTLNKNNPFLEKNQEFMNEEPDVFEDLKNMSKK
jgi:centrosomal protein CEP104